ncbi:uncharacterized protein LOC129168744 [Dunckerocampus dactyliophorus]|uniref:uncharacterized protein LOC129168744 n=1 Tax=Dunckerocampus dactyliophorus TaxID=161453 RepID=UPI00240549B7|nr:uncharacterized protein LOC129168744 [Dunckerocampus dactyliophorus]
MTLWCCALVILCCILKCAEPSAPPPGILKAKYNDSFLLVRSTRSRVQQLLNKYKEHQLGNKHFEHRGGHLKDLPVLSTDFYSWLQLPDWERLHAALSDLQSYKNMLEWKRKGLEKEEKDKRHVHSTLSQSITHIELDVRDLMSQVSSQMSHIKGRKLTFPTARTPSSQANNSKTVWESRVEGYIILRDLDLYLTRLARDFLLLASKT